jgi:hypothetical protein
MPAILLALAFVAPPATLPHGPGWHAGGARVPTPGCARCLQTESWASTIPYRDRPIDFPQRTITALSARGIVVHVTRSWQPSPPSWMLRRNPLRIVRSAIRGNFEGNPTNGRVSQWLATTWRAGSFVTVYVFFGAPRPSAVLVRRAQAELDGLRLADWST